jgi:hypothetical protein
VKYLGEVQSSKTDIKTIGMLSYRQKMKTMKDFIQPRLQYTSYRKTSDITYLKDRPTSPKEKICLTERLHEETMNNTGKTVAPFYLNELVEVVDPTIEVKVINSSDLMNMMPKYDPELENLNDRQSEEKIYLDADEEKQLRLSLAAEE